MITGKKVRLRSYRDEDLKSCMIWINNPAVTRYLRVMRPHSQREEREWVERVTAGADPTQAQLVIESLDGEYLGGVGLVNIDWRNRSAEMGIVVANPDHWGRGYGTEATLLLLRHAFEELNLHRVYLHVHDFNERAHRSYLGVGFVDEGRVREALFRHGEWHDTIVMGMLAPEYFKRYGRTDDGRVRDHERGSPVSADRDRR